MGVFFTAFVPAVGDTVTIHSPRQQRPYSREEPPATTYEVEVLRRSWDLNEDRKPVVTLMVQRVRD